MQITKSPLIIVMIMVLVSVFSASGREPVPGTAVVSLPEVPDYVPPLPHPQEKHKETQLEEVVVTTKMKPKYSKKNNPAVDLMEDIRQSARRQDPDGEPRYSYDKYEKMVLSLNDFDRNSSQ